MAGLSPRSPVFSKCQVSWGQAKTHSPVMIKLSPELPDWYLEETHGIHLQLTAFISARKTLKTSSEIIPLQYPYGEAEFGASAMENASVASCAAHTPII